jgi:hypothetical protein
VPNATIVGFRLAASSTNDVSTFDISSAFFRSANRGLLRIAGEADFAIVGRDLRAFGDLALLS